MTAYYNEIDRGAAAWLRELIKAKAIAPGDVDERSIEDVRPDDLAGYAQCHFFAGIGVWSYALRLAGWPDDRPVWTGSCPCQPFSQAGSGLGTADERHLWPVWRNLIIECCPPTVFGEQVASKAAIHWLALVQDDMEGGGYAFAAFDLPAASVGAPHIRQRLYFVADRRSPRLEIIGEQQTRTQRAPTKRSGAAGLWSDCEWLPCRDGKTRPIEPGTFPLAHRALGRVGRLRGYGNAIVAPLAAEFIAAFCDLS